jgi:putative transposase
VIGFLKGKSAVLIHIKIIEQRRATGLHFWTKGYFVSTAGLNETTIFGYLYKQEATGKKQLEFELK